jgi:hypothetical protein
MSGRQICAARPWHKSRRPPQANINQFFNARNVQDVNKNILFFAAETYRIYCGHIFYKRESLTAEALQNPGIFYQWRPRSWLYFE